MLNVNVKKSVLDPEFHSETSHTEFRLNDINVTYFAGMRLGNVCAFHGENAQQKQYNVLRTLLYTTVRRS